MRLPAIQEAAPAMATAAGVDGSAAELMLDLSAARHAWLAKDAVLLLLKSGQMVLAHLTIEAGMVKRIKIGAWSESRLRSAQTQSDAMLDAL
ncbi:hypothetical protein ABBQ38_000610 [Trebouxia sp. C0009 RCD-2024]